MGKKIQITNTIILGIIAIPLIISAIISIIWALIIGGNFSGILKLNSLLFFLGCLISLIYFGLLIKSFKKCNLNNGLFRWAFYLNLLWIIIGIISFIGIMIFVLQNAPSNLEGIDFMNSINAFMGIISYILVGIYFVSFILFLMGYVKCKK